MLEIRYFLLILCIIGIESKSASKSSKEKLGLYGKTDAVVVLEGGQFQTNVFGSDHAWVVEFYNTWCGHCVTFAPTWKAMARQLIAWRPVISVAAVDCACENNTDICRTYDVHAFPHFLLMPPYATGQDRGVSFQEQDSSPITNLMLDFVTNVTDVEIPHGWPRINPIENMHEIWDEAKDEHRHIAFVFEDDHSYVGRQVILDMLPYKRILVRRMLKGAVKKFGITSFPTLCLINRDGTFKPLSSDNNTRAGYVHALKQLLISTGDLDWAPDPDPGALGAMVQGKPSRGGAKGRMELVKPGVYMKDLESTLHYAFRQEIAIHRNIDGEKLTALNHFIETLVKYFPGRSAVVRYLENVHMWLKTMTTDLTGDLWVDSIDELQTLEAYLPDRVEWVTCKGSEPRFRGYPCGLWMLFHTLTVSAYEIEGGSNMPLDVLDAIAGYMKHFFGCRTCVDHFLKMADTITSADKSPRAAVMWLWQAHNKANNRLHGDPSEDPKHPKLQFPSKDLCPKCRDGQINKDKIFDFLFQFYGKHSIIKSAEDEDFQNGGNNVTPAVNDMENLDWWELHQRRKDLEKIHELRLQKREKGRKRKEQEFAVVVREKYGDLHDSDSHHFQRHMENSGAILGWGFNNLDMSMCIIFYLMCTVIILVLYYHFIVRRKHNPCKMLPR